MPSASTQTLTAEHRRHISEGQEVLRPGVWHRLIRARGACERCGGDELLEAHHKDHDHENNVLSNGELLCVECHDAEHGHGGSLVAWRRAVGRLAEASRGKPRSEETRRRISEALKQVHEEDPTLAEHISEALTGKPLSDEHKRTLSASQRARFEDPAERLRISEALRRAYEADPELRKRCGAAMRGKHHTEESNARRSASMRAAYESDPDLAARKGDSIRGVYERDPTLAVRISGALRGRPKSPETRRRMVEAQRRRRAREQAAV